MIDLAEMFVSTILFISGPQDNKVRHTDGYFGRGINHERVLKLGNLEDLKKSQIA